VNHEELVQYEGKIVCLFHREGEQYLLPSRWTRGVVHKGICYDLSIQQVKADIPSIHLEAMRTEYIAKIFSLKRSQQTPLERRVCETLKRGKIEIISLKVPLVFDLWREDKEKETEKNLKNTSLLAIVDKHSYSHK
jgi:hypothetical protein